MLSGNIIAQAIALAASPIITRLYSPQDFGIMVYLTSLVNILSITANLRYDSAIVLPKKQEEAYQLFILCIGSALIISGFYEAIVIKFDYLICNILGKSWLLTWLWIVPIGVLVASIFKSLTFIHTRNKSFHILSLSRVSISISGASIKIILGFIVAPSVVWLIIGNIFSPIIAIFILTYTLFKQNFFNQNVTFGFADIKKVASKYKKFPKYSLPTNLLNSVSQNLPILLLAYFYGQEVIGFYGLANSVLKRPITIMGESFGRVFLQKAAEEENLKRNLKRKFLHSVFGLSMIGIIPFLILTVSGQYLFSVLFGQHWAEAGLYAQILAPWLFLGFINSPATQIIIAKQALRFNLIFNIMLLIIRSLSIIGGYYLFTEKYIVIMLFSMSGIIMNIIYIYYAFTLTNENS